MIPVDFNLDDDDGQPVSIGFVTLRGAAILLAICVGVVAFCSRRLTGFRFRPI